MKLDGEGNQQVLLRESRAAGTSVIYGLYNGRFFTVAWITLHACLKTKEIYLVAVQGPEEISSRVNKKHPVIQVNEKGLCFIQHGVKQQF